VDASTCEMGSALGLRAPMALLTAITDEDARELLAAYDEGALETLEPLAAGSVNSNFSVRTAGPDGKRLFLRVYEERDREGAATETAMVERLARAGVPSAPPVRRSDGGLVSELRGKPAALFVWRQGTIRCGAQVTAADARAVGRALARVHVAGAGELLEPSRFRYEDLQLRLDRVAASGDARFVQSVPSLRDALASAHRSRPAGLPRGLIHGDLFRDNVLWEGDGTLAALLDFESASDGTFAYDLMVTILAWCVGDDLDLERARAMREGYEEVRPLTDPERQGLAAEGAFAALRFAVTRITDFGMRTAAGGPPPARDWRRFLMRFDKLRALGADGVRRALSA
jgi:homoserine kinase type II